MIPRSLPRIALVAGLVLAALAARASGGAPRTVAGGCQPVFGGDVCTWATMAGERVTEFGATVPMATVTNAPMDGPMVFPPVANAVIPLPAEVVRATGFDHLAVNWEAHGHPPATFLTPHFDFHFYTVAPGRVTAIDCADQRKPARLPASYSLPDVAIPGMGTLVGLCVPQMGMHSVPTQQLSDTSAFGASMLVGYYQQGLIFLEPMISQARLAQAKSFSMTVPALPGTDAGLRWPTRFEASYDAKARAYHLVFSGLPAN
jgi:hypothetical protein